MSAEDQTKGAVQEFKATPSVLPEEFGRAMRQIHSGELTALSQRTSIRELRSAAGMIVKIHSDPSGS